MPSNHEYADVPMFASEWNSTKYALKSEASDGRFNSQRDGILPKIRLSENITKGVSIPNGMEFYQKFGSLKILRKAFQFPTGWNSTLALRLCALSRLLFQFPTGWNSTLMRDLGTFQDLGFNSQRDGILRSAACKLYRLARVSIPNGMEFYPLPFRPA